MQTRPLPEHWWRTDALIALVLTVAGFFMAWLMATTHITFFDHPLWLQGLGNLAICLPLIWRRRFPLIAISVQSVAYTVASFTTGMDVYTSQVALFLGFYSIGAWAWQRERALLLRILICLLMGVAFLLGALHTFGKDAEAGTVSATQFAAFLAINGIINIAYFTGAWIFGDRAWEQALERRELEQANASINALQAQLIESAVEEERLRIARELHDVVAHHVTAMSVQSAAARRLIDRDPAQAVESLKQVEASGRSAVQDLRTMVLTLRDVDESTSSWPTLADLDSLVDTARRSGQHATYEVIGDIPHLTPAGELAIYRAAQEGLTNAAKHAGPLATVHVRLRGLPHAVELEVADDGRGGSPKIGGAGTGLIGMRERITAVGGTLEVGPKPRGGFRIRATVPAGAAR